MKIYGAGLSGLICANMLRRFSPTICEAQKSLPNNHGALLRFKTDVVGKATGIPFQKVPVQKAIYEDGWPGKLTKTVTLKHINQYSQRVTGDCGKRSIASLEDCERHVAPFDFIEKLSRSCNIVYGMKLNAREIQLAQGRPIISTIPMPALMEIVGWREKPHFNYKPIWSYTAYVANPGTDIYQTVYFPDDNREGNCHYRVSITGRKFIMECTSDPNEHYMDCCAVAEQILQEVFGIRGRLASFQTKYHKFGKLLPIDESIRRKFIYAMSSEYNIYSLGRFATWRQIQLDDVVKDVHQIERFMESSDYHRMLSAHKGEGR